MIKLKKHYQKPITITIIIVVLLAGASIGLDKYLTRNRIIPPAIAKQIVYTVYWPNSRNSTTNKNTIKFDSSQGADVFSYITFINSVSTTVTEQATPTEFTDAPQYYPALINHLNNFASFDSTNGTIYLTRPNNTKGVVAVSNNSGTLIFAHASGNISQPNWLLFFNNLKVILN